MSDSVKVPFFDVPTRELKKNHKNNSQPFHNEVSEQSMETLIPDMFSSMILEGRVAARSPLKTKKSYLEVTVTAFVRKILPHPLGKHRLTCVSLL